METTDFTTQAGRSQLGNLRHKLARAVSENIGHTAKNTWLVALIGIAIIDVTADESFSRDTLDTDQLSNNSTPGLIAALTKAVSESSIYGGDYKTQLLADLGDCDTLLTA